jgi:molecular chaperone DnaK (HSP70)
MIQKNSCYFSSFFFCSESANAAGFNVLRTLSEPISALLSYDIGQTDNALEWYV